MGEDRPAQDDDAELLDASELLDGRLSAIMPRKLFRDDAAVKSGLLQVFVRMKPVPPETDTCMVLGPNNLLKATWRNTEAVYKFSQVFQQDADQGSVYAGTTASLVEDFLNFRQPSAVVMAYGVTSAGKTFTMQGLPDKPGLVPLALKDIFLGINSGSCGASRVSLSVCEIYNECIYDLLAPPLRTKPALKLKEDKQGHIQVQGMSEVAVQSAREALELLKRAAKARQSAGTGVNEHSSRSHAVITIKLQSAADSSAAVAADGGSAVSFLHFVDLAGCERVKRTGNSGARLRESVAINSSLMTLSRCLEVLRYNQQHLGDQKVIPYRESKITHLFKEVLHGNGRFVMVVNVSPACEAFNETKRVLQYAALASRVTMTSEVEHDIAGQPWTAGSHALLPADASATTSAAAGADAAAAAATAASAAVSAAQARIEELLDDKADLEYEIDVVERKVELLREELIRCEVEKEQLESDIRAEVQAEMSTLLEEAAANEKAAVSKAKEEAAAARQEALQAREEAAAMEQKALELELKLQQQEAQQQQQQKSHHRKMKELKAAMDQAKTNTLPIAEHNRLLQETRQAAAAAARELEAKHIAQTSILERDHQQQLQHAQQELFALQAEVAMLKTEQAAAAAAAAAQHAAAAGDQFTALRSLVVDALQLLETVTAGWQQGSSNARELEHVTQQLQAASAQMKQQASAAAARAAQQLDIGGQQLGAWARLGEDAVTLLEKQAAPATAQELAAVTQQLQAVVAQIQHSQQRQMQTYQQQQGEAAAAAAAPAAGVASDTAVAVDDGVNTSAAGQQAKQPGNGLQKQQEQKVQQQVAEDPPQQDMHVQQQQQKQHCGRRATLAGVSAAAAAAPAAAMRDLTAPAALKPSGGFSKRTRRATMAAGLPTLHVQGLEQEEPAGLRYADATAAVEHGAIVRTDSAVLVQAEAPPAVTTAPNADRRRRRATLAPALVVRHGEEQAQPAATGNDKGGAAECTYGLSGACAAAAAGKRRRRTLAGAAATGSMPGQADLSAAATAKERSSRHKAPAMLFVAAAAAAAAAGVATAESTDAAAGLLGAHLPALHSIAETEEGEEEQQGTMENTAAAAAAAWLADTAGATAAAAVRHPRKRRRCVREKQQVAGPGGAADGGPQQSSGSASMEEAVNSKKRRCAAGGTSQDAGQEQQQHMHREVQDAAVSAAPAEDAVTGSRDGDAAAARADDATGNAASAGGAAGFVAGIVANTGSRTAKAPARRKRQVSVKLQTDLDQGQEQGGQHTAGDESDRQEAAAAPAAAGVAAAGRAAGKRQAGSKALPDCGQKEQDSWQPAERVLADVTQQQLGVVSGRRATIATTRPGKSAAGIGGVGGHDAAAGKQGMRHAGVSMTSVAFRTRHRHGR